MRHTEQSGNHPGISEDPSDFCDFGYDSAQAWHTIVFRRGPSAQITGFANEVQARWKAQGMPGGCRAWRQNNKSNGVMILLNPQASALVAQIAKYKPLMQSCAPPIDMSNFPSFKRMGIFI